ncbi:MAG: hypothetical protein AB1488_03830 [Nitrospirota bacterium]
MKTTKYDLHEILRQELKNGSDNLVTRSTGEILRRRIEKELESFEERVKVLLDFSRVGIIDYSCADEIVAKLISRLLSGEYGNKYIVLSGLNENQRENIEVALERKELAAIGELRNGRRLLLGILNNYLRETLDLIHKKGSITAKELSETLNLEANTSGTRLLNLHKKRLVVRTDEIREGGRVWVYKKL